MMQLCGLDINSKNFITTVLLVIGAGLAMIDQQNWGGWLLFGGSFAVLLTAKTIRDDKLVYLTCLAVLLVYHVTSYYINFINPSLSSPDTVRFHENAGQIAMFGILPAEILGAGLYDRILGWFYALNYSRFFGQELNVLACSIFLVYLVKLMRVLAFKHYQALTVVLIALLPNYVFWLPTLLREVWELLFFTMMIYYGLSYRLQDNSVIKYLLAIALGIFWGMWHRGLVLYLPVLLFMLLVWPFSNKNRTWLEKIISLIVLAVIAFGAWEIVFYHPIPGMDGSYELSNMVATIPDQVGSAALLSGDAVTMVAEKQVLVQPVLPAGNTGYVVVKDYSSWLAAAKSALLNLYYYLFTPMPWQVNSLVKFGVMGWVLLRILLLAIIAFSYKKLSPREREITLWFLIVYFSFALVWAIGTSNYGTALRHQILTDWLLILLGAKTLDVLTKTTK